MFAKYEFSNLPESRGGTDFECVIDYAKLHEAKNVIILTDGFAPQFDKPDNMNVIVHFIKEPV